MFLPLIIFATGYNMRRKNFFENFTNISKFGLLGTFLTFVFYSLMTWSLFQFDGFEIDYRYYDWGTKPAEIKKGVFKLNAMQAMYISSIFCSSDIIAAVTLVKFEEQPKLFSIILGEGLFNDAVAIILYQTMQKLSKGSEGAR